MLLQQSRKGDCITDQIPAQARAVTEFVEDTVASAEIPSDGRTC